jgi:hypothetical protein
MSLGRRTRGSLCTSSPLPEKGCVKAAFAPFHAQLGPLQVTMARFYGIWVTETGQISKIHRVREYQKVFERCHLNPLAETAHPRPLGPKGEGNLVSAGKLQYWICRVAVSFES